MDFLKLHKQHIFLLLFIHLTSFPSIGQTGGWAQYAEIGFYYRWQENEPCGSIYWKAHQHFIYSPEGRRRVKTLSYMIMDKVLWEDYQNMIGPENKKDNHESRLQKSRLWLLVISVTELLLLVSIAVFLILIRKKYSANWKLTQQIQGDHETTRPSKEEPTGKELHIIALADREMRNNHAYREAGLTLDALADRLGIHRNVFSAAINKGTDGNFKQYINSYRIKEAVHIISQSNHKELYIDELYERVGFSNRSSFYRVFKQHTGISPIVYQKNKDLSPLECTF